MNITVTAPGMNPSSDTLAEGSASQSSEAEEYDLPEGSKISDLLQHLGIDAYSPELVLLNGSQADLDDELHDGDAVALGGPMGGM
ncbi:MAG: MoaD/ThiS family protein [Chloroflexota bacterium]|nr:MoaD/ThiS family protein [Chloroflexota bacterium]